MFRRIRQWLASEHKEQTAACRSRELQSAVSINSGHKIRRCKTEGTNAEVSMHFATVMPEAGVCTSAGHSMSGSAGLQRTVMHIGVLEHHGLFGNLPCAEERGWCRLGSAHVALSHPDL